MGPRSGSQGRAADASGELPLLGKPGGSPRSGSFSLEPQVARTAGRDDTLETYDEELVETDDVIEFTAASSKRASTPAPEGSHSSLFEDEPAQRADTQRDADAQIDADAAFAQLFVDSSRPSSAPSARHSSAPGPRHSTAPSPGNSQMPERYADDTETFDASARAFVESAALEGEDHMSAEELDSAEFELMIEGDGTSDPQQPPPVGGEQRAPQSSEKRPSFLGRLFGRKDE